MYFGFLFVLMFQQGKFDAIDSAKESLKQQLEAQRQLLSNIEQYVEFRRVLEVLAMFFFV